MISRSVKMKKNRKHGPQNMKILDETLINDQTIKNVQIKVVIGCASCFF